ncbi:MAG: hypothetical protein ABSD72_13995 [Terracidiphilus sp.]|jgi:hypothetical protein
MIPQKHAIGLGPEKMKRNSICPLEVGIAQETQNIRNRENLGSLVADATWPGMPWLGMETDAKKKASEGKRGVY